MKAKDIVLVLSIICAVCFLYLVSFNFNVFDEGFYSKEFSKYNIYGEFPGKDIDNLNSEILSYLKDGTDYDKELFNEREVKHFEDVKLLFDKVMIVHYSLGIILILLVLGLYLLDKNGFLRNFSRVMFFSGVLILFISVVLLILVKLDFSGFFTRFHYVFFPQGGWLFSASDNIIKLYPFELFYDIASRVFIDVFFYGNLLILAAVLLFSIQK